MPRIALSIVLLSASILRAENPSSPESRRLDSWHQWRGPEGNGTAPRAEPPLRFGPSENLRWKVPAPGEGHASPVVWGDLVFLLSAVRTDKTPAAPPATNPKAKTEAPGKVYRFIVTAIDLESGKTRWEETACEEAPHEGRHETNSYASGSPVTDGTRVYAYFGSRGIYAYGLDGKLQWKRDLGDMHTRFGWGEGASPAVHGGTVVVNWDEEDGSFVTALDAATGEPRWRKERDEATSWATPFIVEHGGKTQVIVNGTNRVRSYDLATGELVWECGGQTANAIPSPVAMGDRVICMSGYRGAAAKAIPLGARGDITESDKVIWSLAKGTPYVPSPLLYEDRLYFTQRNSGILTVVDARTGKVEIDSQRIPGIEELYGSPVGAAGRVYFIARDGTAVVIRHGGPIEVLATNRLEEPVDASPALVGKKMLVRGRKHLFCFEQAPKPAGGAAGGF